MFLPFSALTPQWKKGLEDSRKWLIEDNSGNTIRSLAIQIIKKVEDGHFLDETIDRYFSQSILSDSKKSLIYEIASGVIRWKGYLDWALSRLIKKSVKNEVRYLLWVSLYQISFMKKANYHVVNEAVEYSKKEFGPYVANFINAVLRRFIRDQAAFAETQNSEPRTQNLSILHSFPEWLAGRWIERYGKVNALKLFKFFNNTPEFSVRVAAKKISRDVVIKELENKGIAARIGKYSEYALYIDKLSPVFKTDLFKNGLIHIQDEASQLVGLSINPNNGDKILDACAGLGTKTLQINEHMEGAVIVAMDNEIKRLKHVDRNIYRILGDANTAPFKTECFDIVLLDAPCSSLGIIRKHPEIKWRRNIKDITNFGDYQLKLLDSIWDSLKPGGHLIYSVCSFEPEETLCVIEKFGKRRSFVLEKPLPLLFNREYFLSIPYETGMDGFFIAKLKRI